MKIQIYDKIREDSERKWNVRFSFTLFNSSNQLLLLILKAIFFLAYLWHKEEMCFSSDMSFCKHQDNFCLPYFLQTELIPLAFLILLNCSLGFRPKYVYWESYFKSYYFTVTLIFLSYIYITFLLTIAF